MNKSLKLFFILFVINIESVLAEEIIGKVSQFIDGDTIVVWNQHIRLSDIDAPEVAQLCLSDRKKEYQCGLKSTEHLKKIVGDSEIKCKGHEVDRYERLLAVCFLGRVNINRQMVLDGWAVKYWRGNIFLEEQSIAMKNNLGLWRGTFKDPSDFRKKARATALKDQEYRGDCIIKGNINSSGDRIYHTPWGSRFYSKTKISLTHGERWFCSEDEAIRAGWRAPYR